MKIYKKLAKYFAGLGVGYFVVSMFVFGWAYQERVNAEDYTWPYLQEGNEAKMIAGMIVLIISLVILVLAFFSLIIYNSKKEKTHIRIQSEPVRQKSCPRCGTDITHLAICPECGHVVKT